MSRNRSRPMANVDVAWLRMDDPTNLMMVTAILSFAEPPRFDRLQATIEERLLRFERFRQRVTERRLPGGRPRWQDDPDFDLSFHLRRITLPPPADEAALAELVSKMMSRPLDRSRPLWQFHLIDNYGAGGAVLARIHHAIANGVALMSLLLSLTDAEPGSARARAPAVAAAPARRRGSLAPRLAAARSGLATALTLGGRVVGAGLDSLLHPSRAAELLGTAGGGIAAAGRLLVRRHDPSTCLRGRLGVRKRAAWSEAIPLVEIKDLAQAVGGTVNDVLLAALTGALRRYLKRREPLGCRALHAAVPVNLRPAGEPLRLGNRFGLIFLELPVGIADPLERLHELKRRMDRLKGSRDAWINFGLLAALGLTPARIQDAFVDYIGARTTLVMTNVPGPRHRVYLAGAPLRSMMFWVPQSGRVGLGVSILSYAGEVRVGVASDAALVPDPEAIARAFPGELEELGRELARPGRAA